MKRFPLLWMLLLFVPLTLVAAQDDNERPHPLFDMLALVPNSENAIGSAISYVDYVAIVEARDYMPDVAFTEELVADEEQFRLWRSGMNRIRSGYSDLPRVMAAIEDIPETVGFDLLDMTRTLEFGRPPLLGRIYEGDFNSIQINQALTERDYIPTELVGIPAWCADEECEEGIRQNLPDIYRSDVFDPALGRKPAVLDLTDLGYLASSPGKPAMFGVAIAAQSNESNPRASILGIPEYRTAAEVATAPDGLLIQMQFLPGLSLLSAESGYTPMEIVDLTLFASRDQFESGANVFPYLVEDVIPSEWLTYGELPAFEIVAFVDRQEGDDQVAQLVVVYQSTEEAEAAATELEQRIRIFSGQIPVREDATPFIDLYQGQATVESSVYTSEDTGLSAAVVSVRYPVSENESAPLTLEMTDDEIPRIPGGIFTYWITSLYRRSFYPLWQISLPDWAYEDAQ